MSVLDELTQSILRAEQSGLTDEEQINYEHKAEFIREVGKIINLWGASGKIDPAELLDALAVMLGCAIGEDTHPSLESKMIVVQVLVSRIIHATFAYRQKEE